jgi:poly(A) polymerase
MEVPPTDPTLAPTVYTRDQHTLSRSFIDSDALKIMYRLVRNGYKAYLVGGGVRDVLLGKKPKDFDIATDATPRQVKALFRNSRMIGRRFKLVHIFFPNLKYIEVSTFRDNTPVGEESAEEDIQSHTAHDNFYGTAETDARRRDLTINALFYDVSDYSIIDYVGGFKDLRDRIVRVIGEPLKRFIEDPVRMMRVVRHAARTGFTIEPTCFRVLQEHRELLRQASQVRVYEEFKKDLISGYVLETLRRLAESGLLPLLLPKFCNLGVGLLEDGMHLPICLERIDTMVRFGMDVSATIPLSVIFLHLEPRIIDDSMVTSRQSDGDYDSGELIRYAFEPLLVPRKERERIEDLCDAYHRTLSAHENNEPLRFSRHVPIDELIMLFSIMLGEDAADWLRRKTKKPQRDKPSKKKRGA